MKYIIMGRKIDGKDLPRNIRTSIILSKTKKLSWVAQVALISALVDLALRAML